MKTLVYATLALLPFMAGCSDDGADTTGAGGNDATNGSATNGATTNGATTATNGTTTGGMGGSGPGNYPPGPYGTEVGDTIAFFEMEGYLSPTAGNFGEYVDFDMLDVQSSGSPAVLLHLAAMF